MGTFGEAFTMLPEEEKNFSMIPPEVIPPVENTVVAPTSTAKPWYDNSGFYAKLGAVGSALLPKDSPLGKAGAYASNYHQAQQLDNANKNMLANVAAGKSPTEGLDTTGLSAEQITGLNKSGLEQEKFKQDKVMNASTLESGETNRRYQETMMRQVDQNIKLHQNKVTRWDDTIKGWEDKTIKLPKFIPEDFLPVLKSMGSESGDALIKELMRESAANPQTTVVTDKKGGKVHGVDTKTGVIKWSVNTTPDRSGEGGTKVGFVSKGEEHAFSEMLPQLKESYYKSLGSNAEAAKSLAGVMAMLADPMKAGQARATLIGAASKEQQKAYRTRVNEVSGSLHDSGEIPEPGAGKTKVATPSTELPPVGTPGHATLPQGQKVDMKLLREVGSKLQKNLKRPATAQELRDAYAEAAGGKK